MYVTAISAATGAYVDECWDVFRGEMLEIETFPEWCN